MVIPEVTPVLLDEVGGFAEERRFGPKNSGDDSNGVEPAGKIWVWVCVAPAGAVAAD